MIEKTNEMERRMSERSHVLETATEEERLRGGE